MKQNAAPLLFGIPDKKQRFDLPLHTRLGTEFLVMLLALMTSLCLLTVMGGLSLGQMAQSWQSDLENTLTIEIPYIDGQDKLAEAAMDILKNHPSVKTAKALENHDVSELLKPFLGSIDRAANLLPIPKLIAVELKSSDPEKLSNLKESLQQLSDKISIDAHEQWMDDVHLLTKAMQIIGIILVTFISLVTFLTVSGAVRSRMAIHQQELELLHIMGAHDKYIRNQFQKYILHLAGKGILYGTLCTSGFLILAGIISTQLPETMPRLHLMPVHIIAIPVVAAALITISISAARRTVSHVLKEIP